MKPQEIVIGTSLMAFDPPDFFADAAAQVNSWGFDYFWVADSSLHGRYVYPYMTLAVERAPAVRVGTNCTHPLSMHPAMTANAIATIHEISGGRAVLGIGAGGGPTRELGHPKPAKVADVEAMVHMCRSLLRGETVTGTVMNYELTEAHLYYGANADNPPPIFLTASGPRMLEAAGRVADGVLIHCGASPEALRFAMSCVERGAESVGRSLDDVDVAWHVWGAYDSDEQAARDAAKPGAASLAMIAPDYCKMAGVPQDVVDEVRNAYTGRHFTEAYQAHAAVTDDMVDRVMVAGGAERWRDLFRVAASVGVRHIELFPLGDRLAVSEVLAQARRDA
jgi:5,10-methylenetetrahydromethanopterin reductase